MAQRVIHVRIILMFRSLVRAAQRCRPAKPFARTDQRSLTEHDAKFFKIVLEAGVVQQIVIRIFAVVERDTRAS